MSKSSSGQEGAKRDHEGGGKGELWRTHVPVCHRTFSALFRLVSATAALIRCFMFRLAPSGLRLRFPRFSANALTTFPTNLATHSPTNVPTNFQTNFQTNVSAHFFGLTSFAGMVAGRGGAGFFGRGFGGQGEVFGRRFSCKRTAGFSLEWHGNLMFFLWLEGSER